MRYRTKIAVVALLLMVRLALSVKNAQTLWFTRSFWLRSEAMVHSLTLAALSLIGSLQLPGYARTSWLAPSFWLRSALFVHSLVVAALTPSGSLHGYGCALIVWFSRYFWLNPPPNRRVVRQRQHTVTHDSAADGSTRRQVSEKQQAN